MEKVNSRLKVDKVTRYNGFVVYGVTGFTPEEMSELLSMEHREARETILNMIDRDQNGLATIWHNGGGIYGLRIGFDTVYVDVGDSCD